MQNVLQSLWLRSDETLEQGHPGTVLDRSGFADLDYSDDVALLCNVLEALVLSWEILDQESFKFRLL